MRTLGHGYDECKCGRLKSTRAQLCRTCRTSLNRPPIDLNVYVIDGVECRRIPLTKGLYATVDATDYEQLMSQGAWHTSVFHGKPYATKHTSRTTGRRKTLLMHSLVCSVPDGKEVDHKDGDGLNNTRNNLRPATHAQNMGNLRKNGRRFKGVSFSTASNKWRARIRCGTTMISVLCDTEIDAAKVYNYHAVRLYGEFAHLNLLPDE